MLFFAYYIGLVRNSVISDAAHVFFTAEVCRRLTQVSLDSPSLVAENRKQGFGKIRCWQEEGILSEQKQCSLSTC